MQPSVLTDQAVALPASEVQILLFIFGASLILNILISGLLYWKQGENLNARLLQYWLASAISFMIQGLTANLSTTWIAASSIGMFLPTAASVYLLSGVFRVPFPTRLIGGTCCLGLLLFAIAVSQGASFFWMTLPIVAAGALPIFWMTFAVLRNKSIHSTSEYILLTVYCLIALHGIDYAWLRDNPDFAVMGFSLAFVFFLGISYLAPIVVHERIMVGRIAEEQKLRQEIETTHQQLSVAYDELETAQENLVQRQKQEALGMLAGGIAHDFNSILAIIQGYTERLQKKAPAECMPDLKMVQTATARAADLVRQIRTFSQPDLENFEPVFAHEKIDEALAMVRTLVPTKVQLNVELQDNLVVECAPGTIHQIMINLVSNAFKALGEEQGSISISLVKNPSDRLIVLQVCDDGCGIPSETIAQIWDPFFTTREPGAGSGLGLPVVKSLVTAMGGTIEVESDLGRGTIFTVKLPPSSKLPVQKKTMATVAAGKASIMVIDDEADITELFRLVLTDHGYTVHTYNSPLQAIEAFDNTPQLFDLVITDLRMPGLNGLHVASRLRQKQAEIPIILITGYSDKGFAALQAEIELSAILEKPAPLDTILETVQHTLEQQSIS